MTNDQRQRIAGALYAFSGGFADASSYLLYGSFAGHVTGNLILLTITLAKQNWAATGTHAVSILSFLLCTSVGFRVSKLRFASLWLACFQTILLGVAAELTKLAFAPPVLGLLCLCSSLGLQNGVVSSTLGIHVHSTFVSGDATSLLKSRTETHSPTTRRKGAVLSELLLCFTLGALTAAILASRYKGLLIGFILLPTFGAAYLQSGIKTPVGQSADPKLS